jgi:ribosomal protein S27AE
MRVIVRATRTCSPCSAGGMPETGDWGYALLGGQGRTGYYEVAIDMFRRKSSWLHNCGTNVEWKWIHRTGTIRMR